MTRAFQCSIECSEQKILHLGPEFGGEKLLFWGGGKQRKLRAVFFGLQPFQYEALFFGKAGISDSERRHFLWKADQNAIGPFVAEETRDSTFVKV